MNYKNIVMMTAVSLSSTLASVSASAIPTLDIDFRDWSAASGLQSYTMGGVEAEAVDTIPGPGSSVAGYEGRVGSVLSHDSGLGLGIQDSNCGTGPGIDSCEVFRVRFDWDTAPVGDGLTGVWLTSLFETGGSTARGERARVRLIELNGPGGADNVISFDTVAFGSESNSDGEQYVDFGGSYRPDLAVFAAPGFFSRRGNDGDEFHVAGFTISVDEPAAFGLMGLGLLFLAGARRLRRY